MRRTSLRQGWSHSLNNIVVEAILQNIARLEVRVVGKARLDSLVPTTSTLPKKKLSPQLERDTYKNHKATHGAFQYAPLRKLRCQARYWYWQNIVPAIGIYLRHINTARTIATATNNAPCIEFTILPLLRVQRHFRDSQYLA